MALTSPVLKYATNAPEFDFTEFKGMPPTRYVIASSPRCGSNMLQRSLWQSRVAGAPEEYLTEAYAKDFATRWQIKKSADIDIQLFLAHLTRFRTSPNGVFGLKVHGSHLSNVILRNCSIDELLAKPKYIVIRRQDKIRQAVSLALARQTGVWILDGKWLADQKPNTANVEYSFKEVKKCLDDIIRDETVWDKYLAIHKIEPFYVKYEEFVTNYVSTILSVFSFLGIEIPTIQITSPGIRRQATSVNKEWADRFAQDSQREIA
jgi:LPS sulfotransferase NodH